MCANSGNNFRIVFTRISRKVFVKLVLDQIDQNSTNRLTTLLWPHERAVYALLKSYTSLMIGANVFAIKPPYPNFFFSVQCFPIHTRSAFLVSDPSTSVYQSHPTDFITPFANVLANIHFILGLGRFFSFSPPAPSVSVATSGRSLSCLHTQTILTYPFIGGSSLKVSLVFIFYLIPSNGIGHPSQIVFISLTKPTHHQFL